MNQEREELMLDLLCKKAVYGLSDAETRQLEELEKTSGRLEDADSIELTVAALSLAGLDYDRAEMPKNLQARVAAEAERFFDERDPSAATSPQPAAAVESISPSGSGIFGWLGWAAAAAACVALALNIYTSRNTQPIAINTPQPVQTPRTLTPAEQREQLMASAPDLARGTFGPGNMKSVVPAGDVVWSDAKQTGYMRFANLPKNDPSKETYQLWIFDETQDEKTPIDGGTFDITADGEVVIPINAKLNPHNTKAFAITVEKPGGVVVSKREKIIALAKRDA